MAVGFNGIPFRVRVQGMAQLPFPVRASDSSETYSAVILIDTRTRVNQLAALQSGVSILPAMAGGGVVNRDWGPGAKTLIFPAAAGDEDTRSAILTEFVVLPRLLSDDNWEADATWVLVGST